MSTNIDYLEKKSLKYLNSKKHLNNQKYIDALWIIGKSKTAISRYKVMIVYSPKKKDVYFYEIIDNLAARLFQTTFLFNLDELLSSEKEDSIKSKKIEILENLNKILDLGIDFLKKDSNLIKSNNISIHQLPFNYKGKKHNSESDTNYKLESNIDEKNLFILFGVSNSRYVITLQLPRIEQFKKESYINTSLTIFKYSNENDDAGIKIDEKYERSFKVRLYLKKNGKRHVQLLKNRNNITEYYTELTYNNRILTLKGRSIPIQYLDVTYDEKTLNLIDKRKKEYPNLSLGGLRETFPEIEIAISESRNWRYSLNFRGLLLFLAGVSKFSNKKEIDKKIKNVISNKRIKELAPFLQHWEDFEKEGFPVVKLLIKIADEIKDQLNYESMDLSNNNNDYLLKRVTERYFVTWINFFYYKGIDIHFLNEFNIENETDLFKKLYRYKITILEVLKIFYENDLKTIENLLGNSNEISDSIIE